MRSPNADRSESGLPFDRGSRCVVPIGPHPSTLRNFGWLRKFGRSTLLAQCLQGLLGRCPWPISLLAEQPVAPAVETIACDCGVRLLTSSGDNWLRSVALAALVENPQRVLLVHGLLGLELLPGEIFQSLIDNHIESEAHFTLCGDLPAPLYAAVCEPQALALFASLPDGVTLNEQPFLILNKLAGFAPKLNELESFKLLRVRLLPSLGIDPKSVPQRIPDTTAADLGRIEASLGCKDPARQDSVLSALRSSLIAAWETESRNTTWPKPASRNCNLTLLFASSPSAFSGAEQALVSTIRSLRGQADIHCLIGQEGLFSIRAHAEGATVHCPHRDFSMPTVPNFLLTGAILNAVSPQLVHCNAFVGTPLLAQARSNKVAILQWARLANPGGMLDHYLAADIVTAVSQFVRNRLIEHMVNPAKIRVLYDGVDPNEFTPPDEPQRLAARQEFGLTKDDFVILCPARFVAYKRHDVLLRGFAEALKISRHLLLLLAGEAEAGDQRTLPSILSLISHLEISDRVLFSGFRDDTKPLFSAADAVALCSDCEPLGCAVLESMAMARPLILSNSGGFPEMVEDGWSGLLFEAGDAQELARRFLLLSKSPNLAFRLGENARKTALEKFSLAAHVRALNDIYEEAIDQASCSRRLPC